jgi:hypothetical protein
VSQNALRGRRAAGRNGGRGRSRRADLLASRRHSSRILERAFCAATARAECRNGRSVAWRPGCTVPSAGTRGSVTRSRAAVSVTRRPDRVARWSIACSPSPVWPSRTTSSARGSRGATSACSRQTQARARPRCPQPARRRRARCPAAPTGGRRGRSRRWRRRSPWPGSASGGLEPQSAEPAEEDPGRARRPRPDQPVWASARAHICR